MHTYYEIILDFFFWSGNDKHILMDLQISNVEYVDLENFNVNDTRRNPFHRQVSDMKHSFG